MPLVPGLSYLTGRGTRLLEAKLEMDEWAPIALHSWVSAFAPTAP